jgi:hypothetical protein
MQTLTGSWFAALTRILKVMVPPLDAASGMETLRGFILCVMNVMNVRLCRCVGVEVKEERAEKNKEKAH